MKKSTSIFFCLVIAAVFAASDASSVFSEALPLVNAIEIRGLRRIEEAAVKSKITHKKGEPLASEKTTNDIKNIYKMGYFDDVKVDIEPFEGGVKLIYLIKEKPTITRVEFQGNEELDDSKLKEKVTITSGSIADTVLIQDNADKLRAFYEEEGYWLSKIVPVVNRLRDSEVSLTYQIEEGPKIKIKEIVIEGNKALSQREIEKVMKTSTWWLFSFVTSSGYYKKDNMNSDIEKIRDLYFNNGFLKVAVADPKIQLTEDKDGMTITIVVSEGEQYKILSVDVAGYKAFTEEALREKITSSPKDIFNRGTLRKDVAALTDMYSENGYALVSVYPDIAPDDATRLVKVTFRIDEGAIYKIGRIEISGNSKTRDKVIRREIRLDEGEKFNSALLKRSYERITNLNFFETVELQPKPRPEEKLVDIDVKVKEKPTGFLSVGGGYSSVDRFIGMVDITQANLFGRGQYVKLRAELGGRSSFYELSFKEPWFLDMPLSFGTSVYKTTRKFIEYDRKAVGFDVSFGKTLSEYWKSDITYNYERATIYKIASGSSQKVRDQEGTRTTSSVTPGIARDSRDNFLDPHKGSRNSLYITYAGLGGFNRFVKGHLDSAWFFPVWETTFSLRGRYGHATGISGRPLPLYERFYVGGIHTVRGLGFGEGGPKDDNGSVKGGTKQVLFNAEYIFPLISEIRLKGLIFFDAGKAYDSWSSEDFRYTAGGGFRWISPVGPLRLEYGYNLKKKHGERKGRWEFTFGTFF